MPATKEKPAKRPVSRRKPRPPESTTGGTARATVADRAAVRAITGISDLIPDDRNANKGTERGSGLIETSLRTYGAGRSILADRAGKIIAGNKTLEGCVNAGIERVRVVQTDGNELVVVQRTDLDLNDKAARELAIVDNRAGQVSLEWDGAELAATAKEFDIDLKSLGFADGELEKLAGIEPPEIVEDEVPTDVPARCKPGELWKLGEHRLLCGDSTKAEDVGRLMEGEKASLCFTSPPYAQQRQYGGESDLTVEHLAEFIGAAMASIDYFAVNLGVARRGGFIEAYWNHYIEAAAAAGLGLVSWNVWSREGMQMSVGQATAMFPIQHEFIFVFGRKPRKLVPTVPNKSAGHVGQSTDRRADGSMSEAKTVEIRDHRELGTVLTLPQVKVNEDHPAQFPVALPAEYIRAFDSDVYDPFCGSGTTIVAAEQLGRRCYAMEISAKYCDVIIARFEKFTGKQAERVEV